MNQKSRLEKLEAKLKPGRDEIKVRLNTEPGLIKDNGKYITHAEWRERYPDRKLIIVDGDYDE